jgi:hypothetical protein
LIPKANGFTVINTAVLSPILLERRSPRGKIEHIDFSFGVDRPAKAGFA